MCFFGFLNEKAIENVIFTQKREVKPSESAFFKTSNPKAFFTVNIFLHVAKQNKLLTMVQRLSVGKYLLSMGLKSV